MHGWLGHSECVPALLIRINRQKRSNEVAVRRIVCSKDSKGINPLRDPFLRKDEGHVARFLEKRRNETSYSLYNGPSLPGR